MEEQYRKEIAWWFAELGSESEVDNYLALFPELNSRLSKFAIGILKWNIARLIDINKSDDVSRIRLILKILDQTPGFDFFDNTFNECAPETVCEIIGMSPMAPVEKPKIEHNYSVDYIGSYVEARQYLDMTSWSIVISENSFKSSTANGNRFYFCGNGEWWDTLCAPGMGFPRDCFGYSLIAVEVNSENKIVSITSRWNTCAGKTGNFITEDELKSILGIENYNKLLCKRADNHSICNRLKSYHMLNIINNTLEKLKTNTEWQERYEGYLSDIWSNPYKTAKGFAKPQGLSVYTTVGDRNAKNYYLRFKGQNVGKVRVGRNGNVTLQCLVKESTSHDIKDCPLKYEEVVDWHSVVASDFRRFFLNDLPKNTKTKSPEHEVENALLEEFRKRIGAEKVLHNIQPILLHGNFFQMPTPLKASTHNPEYARHSGGGIDMLARIKTEGNCHTRLCVIEIKDENKASESQKTAMSQAITYATFVAKLLTEQPDWMEFFMGHKTKRNRNSRCLDKFDIEVVTIMPEGNTETFENETLEVPGTKLKLHCHSLYYNRQKFFETNDFEFSGTFLAEIKK